MHKKIKWDKVKKSGTAGNFFGTVPPKAGQLESMHDPTVLAVHTLESCIAMLKSNRILSNADQTIRMAATGSNISRIITISLMSESWLP